MITMADLRVQLHRQLHSGTDTLIAGAQVDRERTQDAQAEQGPLSARNARIRSLWRVRTEVTIENGL